MKYLLCLLACFNFIYASEQIVFVLANNMDSTKAKLQRYEKINNKFVKISTPIDVNLGRNGLGWASSFIDKEKKNDIFKKEGDKKAPAGVFKLSSVFGYKKYVKTSMPYEQSTNNHICVDDTSSNFYNKIVKTDSKNKFKSYENMLLKNDTYKYVIVVDYNPKRISKKGSCIFLHVSNPKRKETAGCTSMNEDSIKAIISWLDINKEPLLIQIPKSNCIETRKKYNFLDCDLLD